MKTLSSKIILLLTFIAFLAFPHYVLMGAKEGLLLWYQIVLPTLLPFLILTSLFVQTNTFELITRFTGHTLSKLFHTSLQGSFVIIIGFMCGYPMGAKVIHDLYEKNYITKNEAQYLLSFCNNTSPMFLISFLIYQIILDKSLLLPCILAIYGAPMILSIFTRRFYLNTKKSPLKIVTQYVEQNEHSFSVFLLDKCIMSSISLITKIGCYIMLFSIVINLISCFTYGSLSFFSWLLPTLEVTNGIHFINNCENLSFFDKYIAYIFVTTFGGFCAIAQTKCVLEDTDIPMAPYFLQKIITAIIAVIITVLMKVVIY